MPDDEDRRAILDRRARLIAVALSGLALPGCYESHTGEPTTVVDAALDDGGSPVPCLGAPYEDAGRLVPCLSDAGGPTPCLEAPYDAGPLPCLDTAYDAGFDAGGDEGTPMPCLSRA